MKFRLTGLWHNPDFMKLWIGQTVSETGSRITREGIPLIVVIVLAASPAQVGLLTALTSLPVLLLGLLAGVWVDRLRRRPVMIACDLARFIILLTIPLAALTGTLTFAWVCIVAMLTAVFGLIFDLAYRAVLPSLIRREDLLEGNTRLATTESLAEIGGPAVAGFLIQIVSAPIAMIFDALTFLVSAISVASIHQSEPMPEPSDDLPNVRREIMQGLRVIFQHPVLRTIAIGTGLRSFFGNFYAVLYALYAIRDLGLNPVQLGLLVSSGGIGALAGSLLAARLAQRFGVGRTLTTALLVGSLVGFLTPLAGGSVLLAMAMMMTGQIIGDAAMAVFMVNEMTLRQTLVDERLLGRASASIGFLAEGAAPFGSLVAGLLATLLGARGTLLIAVLGGLCVAIWMAFSPVRHVEASIPVETTEALNPEFA